jgi:hypothetical protein
LKNIGKLAVLGAVLAASASYAFADTIGSFVGTSGTYVNTAVNYNGFTVGGYNGTLGSFVQNPIAFIQSSFNTPAVAIGAGSPWHPAIGSSTWVSTQIGTNPSSGPSFVAAQGYYTFTTTFSEASAGLYAISLNLLADDTTAVYLNTGSGNVNEVLAGPLGTDSACSDSGVNCETVINDAFVASLGAGTTNTLTFVVEQTGYADFGLDFTGSVTPTPEPSSLMLLGSGLMSASGLLFRRRKTA